MFPKIVKPPVPNLLKKTPPPDANSFRANVRNFLSGSVNAIYNERRFKTALSTVHTGLAQAMALRGIPVPATELIAGTPQASRYTPEALAQLRNTPVIVAPQLVSDIVRNVGGLTYAGANFIGINRNDFMDEYNRNRILNHEVAHLFDRTFGPQINTYSSSPTFQKFTSLFSNNSPFPGYGKGNSVEQYAQFTEQPEKAKAILGQDISGMFPYYKPDVMRPVQGRANYMPIGPALSPISGERPNANFTAGRPGFVFKQTYKPPPRNVLQENKITIQPQWAEANIPLRRKTKLNIR